MPNVPGIVVSFPNPENIMQFAVEIAPKDGLYMGAKFMFTVNVPPTYPYDPPKVQCDTLVRTFPRNIANSKQVYHPNIDWEGHVCLSTMPLLLFFRISSLARHPARRLDASAQPGCCSFWCIA